MPMELTLKLLEGETDILSGPAAQRMAAIKQTACPRCGSSLHPKLPPIAALFVPEDPLPRMLGECPTCGFLASAQSGVVYSTGDGRKVDDPLPIVIPKKD